MARLGRAANAEFPSARGLVGRADLLRALAVTTCDQLALDADRNAWFGYIRREETPLDGATVAVPPPVIGRADQPAATHRVPLQMAYTVAIVKREARETLQQNEDAQRMLGSAKPLTERQAKARFDSRQVGHEDLVPLARLMPALRRVLGSSRLGQVDLSRLTERLANHDLPRYLPRQRSPRWHPELIVALDFSARLWPYRRDMRRLALQLLRLCGRGSVSIRIVDGDPWKTWVDWQDAQRSDARGVRRRQWKMPPPGTPVLLVSDMGLLLGPESLVARAWRRFTAELARAQTKPTMLAPLATSQLDASVVGAVRVLRWSADAHMRLERARSMGQPPQKDLDELLALMSAVRRVDPQLLRAMRRLIAGAGNAGLEGAAWCHPDVEAGVFASIRRDASARHLRRFKEMLPATQRALDRIRRLHHAHLRAVVTHEETLLLAAHAPTAVADEDVQEAREFVASLVRSLKEGGRSDASAWRSVAQDMAARADESILEQDRDLFEALVSAANVPGGPQQLPDWADPSRLHDGEGAEHAYLVLDVGQSAVLLQALAPRMGQHAMGAPLRLHNGLVKTRTTRDGRDLVQWLRPERRQEAVCSLSASQPVELLTVSEAITVAPVQRPRGARAWGLGPDGVFVEGPRLAGVHARWQEQLTFAALPAGDGWRVHAPPTGAGTQFGIDEYGVYADVTLAPGPGPMVQRFRWMEQGRFLMGSPAAEPERAADEGPQHAVTLTRGFWLADTACTQAVWTAVWGANPSHFTGDVERPVESVSWTQVQQFLAALAARLPGCEVGLPTEAEWEYACRAGTTTAFNFGEQVTPDLVNYDGNYPYAGSGKGEYRQTTVAVKSLPPNSWGLYEMHGNVWEWCADGLRAYRSRAEVDPIGAIDNADFAPAQRAMRGGSWYGSARRARSAFRLAFPPGGALDFLGFRVCLRSIEPGVGLPGGQPQGARPPRVEAGQAPRTPSILDRARDALFSTRRKRR